eukprot:TRINITY_DN11171_c0_g1_i2.p1 TRINITY_DN11171_c0_g1~~TRINITY_DN11171_c0_g1_i2.p1  ORF type:complete len:330 (+),score=19.20 TRINITY_DN11171_c0_g1_i2:50-991(+)
MLDKFLFPAPSPGYDTTLFGSRLLGIPQPHGETMPAVISRPKGKWWKEVGKSEFLLFNLHGNATDIGGAEVEGQYLADRLGCTVLSVEYPGYGLYKGTTNMANINKSVWNAYRFVIDTLKVSVGDVVIFGRSIGTGVASQLASRSASMGEIVRGIILISPYTSILDIVQDHATCVGRALFAHRWRPDVDLPRAKSPILLLHGAADTLIKVSHTYNLISKLKRTSSSPEHDKYIKVNAPSGETSAYKHSIVVRIASSADHNRWEYDADVLLPLSSFLKEHPGGTGSVVLNEETLRRFPFTETVGRPERSSSCIS